MEICQELDSQEWNFSQVFTDVDPIWGTSQDIQATIAKVIDLVSHREAFEKNNINLWWNVWPLKEPWIWVDKHSSKERVPSAPYAEGLSWFFTGDQWWSAHYGLRTHDVESRLAWSSWASSLAHVLPLGTREGGRSLDFDCSINPNTLEIEKNCSFLFGVDPFQKPWVQQLETLWLGFNQEDMKTRTETTNQILRQSEMYLPTTNSQITSFLVILHRCWEAYLASLMRSGKGTPLQSRV